MKSFYCILLFLGIPLWLLAQTSTQNYIVSSMPNQPLSSPTDVSINNSNITIKYVDGLGRPFQTVQKAITPTVADLVSSIEYDDFGRDYHHWLPGSAPSNSGAYVSDFGTPASGGDAKPYATIKYDGSPLNRVTEQYGAGAAWYSAGKKEVVAYATNGSDVKHFYVDGTQMKCDGSYADSTLYGQKITDEDGKTIEEFTDKQGRKVLSRVAGDHDTYYVYDDLDNLRYVLPPLAADALGTNTNGFDESATSTLGLYGYIYHYDGRKRCTDKKLPGCEPIFMVYDLADRLILSQDGNQRAKATKQWTVTKYDTFGRVLYTGLINSNDSRATMESNYSGSVTNESYTGNGPVIGYTSGNLTPGTVLTVNYYDNYGFLSYSGNNPGSMLTSTTLSGYDTPDLDHTKTLLTGTRVYHLDDPTSFKVTANYYDKYGRMVQTRATNHLGGYDLVYNALDFTGKPTKTYKTHGIHGASATITELYTYTYDNGQRLKTTAHSLNGAITPEILAENNYDELGRLSSKSRHNGYVGTGYSYNIRGWINAINNGSWKEQIFYQDDPTNPLYNGNIARSTWTYSRRPTRGYKYTYDELNRLTQANYGECTGLSEKQHLQDEYFGYNKMGSITSIQRKSYGQLIDNLTLHYNGNQLQKGDDAGVSYNWYDLTEYTDYSKVVASDYLYDANGNMTEDLDKDIVAIRYNVLNLPDTIQFKNGNQVINMYTANGQKLRTKYYTAIYPLLSPIIVPENTIHAPYSTSDATLRLDDYLGSILYENGTAEDAAHHPLTKLLTPEGYVDYATPWKPYCYYRQDHLGSIREVDTYQGPHTVVQKTQYYPSGTAFQENFGAGEQAYKFTGKELITMHGLNWQDFGARWLDNARMQFTSPDPLCEKYYSISPYAYCAGNPVNRIDNDGREIIFVTFDHNGNSNNQLTYHNGNFWHENGSRYNPGKEYLSKTLYKTLAVYRGIEKSGNKVLINKLKTLETSKNKHFIEGGNNGSYVLPFERNKTVSETDNMVDKGIPVGTRTVFDFSEEQKSILQNNNKGIPFSDGDQVTHEMEHQYDDDQGKNADFEDNTATDPAEIRGVKNENIERNLEGEEERTTYGGKEIDPNKLK